MRIVHGKNLVGSLLALIAIVTLPVDARACESEISHPITVQVPARANDRQMALIVANAILDDLERLHPSASRCNVAIYSFNVTLKRGLLLVPLPPSLAGEIKKYEVWEDVLPGMIWERFGLDPNDAESDMENSKSGASLCGSNCAESSFQDIGSDGVQYQVLVTYLVSFACSGSNCTLTYTVVGVAVTRVDDGSPYFGSALVQNTTAEFSGGH